MTLIDPKTMNKIPAVQTFVDAPLGFYGLNPIYPLVSRDSKPVNKKKKESMVVTR